jgi:MFS family permease
MMTLGHVSGVVMGRILIAIGSSCAFLGALKTAATWLPMSWFPVAVGLTNTLGVAGGILGQAYLNHLITHQGWRGALSEIVYAGCVLSVALWLFLRGPARVSSAVAFETGSQATPRCQPYGLGKSLRSCLLNPKAWAIALYAGIMVGVVVNAFSELYDVVFLEKAFGVTSQSAAWISSMVFLGIAVGGPLHGVLAGYFGRSRWIQWACVATLVCFVMVIVVMGVGRTFPIQGLFVLYFLVGFFVSSMLLSFPMMSDLFSAEHQAMGFGFLNMLIAFSGFVFQSGLGWMLHVSGVGTGVLTLIIGLGLLHWAVKNR